MTRFFLLVAALVAIIGVAWPLGSAAVGGGDDNAATRLVEAADRTQHKAQTLTQSYNEVIPPARSPFASLAGGRDEQSGESSTEGSGDEEEPTPTIPVTLTPAEHAVKDAMEFLNQAQEELEPGSTEYLRAVNQLKAVWDPRYERAVEEFRRFKYRVDHAGEMSAEYIETQERLTRNINNPEVRARMEQVDALEREILLVWMAQAGAVLGQAETIKRNLDDMNIRITKLELSATFRLGVRGVPQHAGGAHRAERRAVPFRTGDGPDIRGFRTQGRAVGQSGRAWLQDSNCRICCGNSSATPTCGGTCWRLRPLPA